MQNTELIGFALSPQQQRIFILDAHREVAPYFTRATFILQGHVDSGKLQLGLDALCRRHEMLRTRFLPGPSQESLLQVIMPEASLTLGVSEGAEPECEFKLSSGNLLHAV